MACYRLAIMILICAYAHGLAYGDVDESEDEVDAEDRGAVMMAMVVMVMTVMMVMIVMIVMMVVLMVTATAMVTIC